MHELGEKSSELVLIALSPLLKTIRLEAPLPRPNFLHVQFNP